MQDPEWPGEHRSPKRSRNQLAERPAESGCLKTVWSSAALAAILTLDLAPESEALGGFSNSGVLSVVVLYVVAAGMYRTGAISLIVDRLVGVPRTEHAANLRLLPITASASAFLNNTPIVAMLIPVIYDIGTSARLAVSKIYMAVSNASILGGAATLIGTSTNLIIR